MTRRFENARTSRHFAFLLLWTLCAVVLCAATAFADDLQKADTIILCARDVRCVVTVDPAAPEVEALAIAQGRIIAVGDRASVMETEGTHTKIVQLLGKETVMPGFVEPHTHVILTAFNNHLMTNLSSFEPIPETIKGDIEKLKAALPVGPGNWLTASGVDPSRTSPFMASLDADALDQVSTDVPIFVLNQSGHFAYVNHKALEVAGVTKNSTAQGGGVYLKNDKGELTGVLQEAGAYLPFQQAIGKTPAAKLVADDDRIILDALQKTYDEFASTGVTTAAEISLGLVTRNIPKELALLQRMAENPKTPLRIRAYLCNEAVQQPLELRPNDGFDMLRIIGVKFVADGSTQGLTAALLAPYRYPDPPNNKGALNFVPANALFNAAKVYLKDGWQLSMHSNGDASTKQVLDVYEQLVAASEALGQHKADPSERRWRIEHFTVTDKSQMETVRKLGLSPSMTNGHVYYWGHAFNKEILGPGRAEQLDPAKWLVDRRIRFSFNSDSPVTPVYPLLYIATAVTRLWQAMRPLPPNFAGWESAVLGSDQQIKVDDAIRAVTLDAAYQLFLDEEIGSLQVKKRADLVILDRNPRRMPFNPQDIKDIRVLSTYLSGVEKYKAAPTLAPSAP